MIDNDANETDESSGEEVDDLTDDDDAEADVSDDEDVTDEDEDTDSDDVGSDVASASTPSRRRPGSVLARAEGDEEENFINDNLVMDLSDAEVNNSEEDEAEVEARGIVDE